MMAIALLGCGGKKEQERASPGSDPPGVGSQLAPLPSPTVGAAGAAGTVGAAGSVELVVGTATVGSVDPAAIKDWPRLDGLLPEADRRLGQWQGIAITKVSGKTSDLHKPFETYRDFVPALFPGEGGAVSFGMFDPVELGKHGKPALREDNVNKIVVTLDESGSRGGNDHGGGAVTEPADVQLAVTTATGKVVLTGEKLLGIERVPMPGGGGDAKGWTLQVVLDAAGVKTFSKLTLVDAGGTSVPLHKTDLTADAVPFIKLNRSGQLRFRLYKKVGDGFQTGAALRSLVEIKVE